MSDIISTLRRMPVCEQARLINNVREYINNDNFVNTIQNYDINNKQNDKFITLQLNAFMNIPGIRNDISTWLTS